MSKTQSQKQRLPDCANGTIEKSKLKLKCNNYGAVIGPVSRLFKSNNLQLDKLFSFQYFRVFQNLFQHIDI